MKMHVVDKSSHPTEAAILQARLVANAQRQLYNSNDVAAAAPGMGMGEIAHGFRGGVGAGGAVGAVARDGAAANVPGNDVCHICCKVREAVRCDHCEKATCGSCTRKCEDCSNIYCIFCTTTNYDMSYERVFCLECNEDAAASDGDDMAGGGGGGGNGGRWQHSPHAIHRGGGAAAAAALFGFGGAGASGAGAAAGSGSFAPPVGRSFSGPPAAPGFMAGSPMHQHQHQHQQQQTYLFA